MILMLTSSSVFMLLRLSDYGMSFLLSSYEFIRIYGKKTVISRESESTLRLPITEYRFMVTDMCQVAVSKCKD